MGTLSVPMFSNMQELSEIAVRVDKSNIVIEKTVENPLRTGRPPTTSS